MRNGSTRWGDGELDMEAARKTPAKPKTYGQSTSRQLKSLLLAPEGISMSWREGALNSIVQNWGFQLATVSAWQPPQKLIFF